jgi:tripartite-type tricarboxylate transporter receptor subunit TctC
MMAGITMRHRPYAQTRVLYDDLAVGRVALTFNNIMSALPLIEAGEVLGLAVTSAQRSPRAPGLPTVAECGFAGYEFENWLGIVAPPDTPATIATGLGDAIAHTVDSSDVRALLAEQGMQPTPGTPAQFALHIAAEVTRWSRVVASDRGAFSA